MIKQIMSLSFFLGIVLWIIAFTMDVKLVYPHAFIFAFVSVAFLILGIVLWSINYVEVNKSFPNPLQSLSDMLEDDAGQTDFGIILFRYSALNVRGFIIFATILMMSSVFIGRCCLQSDRSFRFVSEYVRSNDSLKKKLGAVKYFGLVIGSDSDEEHNMIYYFSIIGEKSKVDATITVKETNKTFEILEASYE